MNSWAKFSMLDDLQVLAGGIGWMAFQKEKTAPYLKTQNNGQVH